MKMIMYQPSMKAVLSAPVDSRPNFSKCQFWNLRRNFWARYRDRVTRLRDKNVKISVKISNVKLKFTVSKRSSSAKILNFQLKTRKKLNLCAKTDWYWTLQGQNDRNCRLKQCSRHDKHPRPHHADYPSGWEPLKTLFYTLHEAVNPNKQHHQLFEYPRQNLRRFCTGLYRVVEASNVTFVKFDFPCLVCRSGFDLYLSLIKIPFPCL